jgi:L-rhamnose mutarotase
MLTAADVTQQFLLTIIEIIGRKTSQEYAAVTVRNLLRKLQSTYPFLHQVEIKHTYSLEMERCVKVQESLNEVNPKKIGIALKELTKRIMESMGKTAGYFFIREAREKIGNDYDAMLMKTMDVDLTLMQSHYIVEKKSIALLEIQNSDVLRRFLKTMIDVMEKQTSRNYAIRFIAQQIETLQHQYEFLKDVSVNDIRYTLGAEEVTIPLEINNVSAQDLGKAIQSILYDTDKTLIELGRNSIVSDLKGYFTIEYLSKLEEMNVSIIIQELGYEALFRQILKALIDIFSKVSTENYAIFVVNSILRKLDSTYQFFKEVNIDPATSDGELYHITITSNIDSISETEARRGIQQLLVTTMDSLGENAKEEFIKNFKESIEKKYLSKIEELGVNFHMIELHQTISTKSN